MVSRKLAWQAFSKFIRLRDAIRTTGTTTRCKCITCGREYPIEGKGSIQAGHFLCGRHDAVLFDEQGTNGQCLACNVLKSGRWVDYYMAMKRMYGQAVIDEMLTRYFDYSINYGPAEYQAIQRKYEGRLAMLRLGVKR